MLLVHKNGVIDLKEVVSKVGELQFSVDRVIFESNLYYLKILVKKSILGNDWVYILDGVTKDMAEGTKNSIIEAFARGDKKHSVGGYTIDKKILKLVEMLKSDFDEAKFPITDLKEGVVVNGIQQTDNAVLYSRVVELLEDFENKLKELV